MSGPCLPWLDRRREERRTCGNGCSAATGLAGVDCEVAGATPPGAAGAGTEDGPSGGSGKAPGWLKRELSTGCAVPFSA